MMIKWTEECNQSMLVKMELNRPISLTLSWITLGMVSTLVRSDLVDSLH